MELPWYPRWMADYALDTRNLSLMEHGAYSLLLDAYYANCGPLLANAEHLENLCGARTSEEKQAIATVCKRYFTEVDGKLVQKRAEEEIDRRRKLSETRASAAKSKSKHLSAIHSIAQHSSSRDGLDPSTSLKSKKTLPRARANGHASLPDWVPVDAWDGWMEMRKKKKAPATDDAIKINLARLAELRKAGSDPRAVLEQSTARGWTGLFELRGAVSTGGKTAEQILDEMGQAHAPQ